MTGEKVLIVIGSSSDLKEMSETKKLLDELGVSSRITIASAHRTPEKARRLAMEAKEKGVKVIIAGAGYAAHLAGAFAANTTLPVIGVPLPSSALSGVDALLATAQMPAGVPVAAMTIGTAGAKNAAVLAVQMLALSDESLSKKLIAYKKKLEEKVEKEDGELRG